MTGYLNQDMSKFTSIKPFDDYKAAWLPFLTNLGDCGDIIYCFIYKCFHAYYEIKDNNIEQVAPGFRLAKKKDPAAIHETLSAFCKSSTEETHLNLREAVKAINKADLSDFTRILGHRERESDGSKDKSELARDVTKEISENFKHRLAGKTKWVHLLGKL